MQTLAKLRSRAGEDGGTGRRLGASAEREPSPEGYEGKGKDFWAGIGGAHKREITRLKAVAP